MRGKGRLKGGVASLSCAGSLIAVGTIIRVAGNMHDQFACAKAPRIIFGYLGSPELIHRGRWFRNLRVLRARRVSHNITRSSICERLSATVAWRNNQNFIKRSAKFGGVMREL